MIKFKTEEAFLRISPQWEAKRPQMECGIIYAVVNDDFCLASVLDIELVGHTSLSSREIPLFIWKKVEDQIPTILKLHFFLNCGWTYKWDIIWLPMAHKVYLYVIMLVCFHWLGSSFLSWSLCAHRVMTGMKITGVSALVLAFISWLTVSLSVRFQAFSCLHFVIRAQRTQMGCVCFCVGSGRS